MAVLVDPPAWPAHGRRWSHLVSDESFAELHTFARRLGVPERGFEGDHYDIPEERYADAVHAGAIPVSSRELLRRLQACGLRRPKRRGERVLSSISGEQDGHRLDTVLSSRPPTGRVGAVLVVARQGSDLLVLPDDDAFALPRVAGEPDDDVLRAVLDELLGPPWPTLTPVQVGYLRVVTPQSKPPNLFEVVLQWTALPGSDATPSRPPAMWLDAGDAANLLPAAVAPLMHRRVPGAVH